jgi:hypothetical protein
VEGGGELPATGPARWRWWRFFRGLWRIGGMGCARQAVWVLGGVEDAAGGEESHGVSV